MKKGDLVRSKGLDWTGRVTGNATNVRLVWLDGDLEGREANVPRDQVEVCKDGPVSLGPAAAGVESTVVARLPEE